MIDYKKLTKQLIREADEVINFTQSVSRLGKRGEQKARDINNRRHRLPRSADTEFESIQPRLITHPWVQWAASFIRGMYVSPFIGRRATTPEYPAPPDDVPETVLTAIQSRSFHNEWFRYASNFVARRFYDTPALADPNKLFPDITIDLPSEQIDNIKNAVINMLKDHNEPAFVSLMSTHPHFLYDAIAIDGASWSRVINQLALETAAKYIWEEVATAEIRIKLLNAER